MLKLKDYQQQSLETLGSYFRLAGEHGAKMAFMDITQRPYPRGRPNSGRFTARWPIGFRQEFRGRQTANRRGFGRRAGFLGSRVLRGGGGRA